MKKKTGIWIDKRAAKIISLAGDSETLQTIPSELEEFHVKGGSGTKLKGGPQDVVHDSKYLERERHQLRAFFREIAAAINDVDALVIFGPAQMPDKLSKELSEEYPQLYQRLTGVEKADSMTENQLKAWVREHFAV